MASSGEVSAFDSKGVMDAEGSGVDRCVVRGEVSTLPCIARVVTGIGEAERMRRISVAEVLSEPRAGKEGATAALSWSCGTARVKDVEAETSWMWGIQFGQ